MSSGADYNPRLGLGAFSPALFRQASIAQVAPFQNQWYPVLNTTNVKVWGIVFMVETTGETLELRITADGVISSTLPIVSAADTVYRVVWRLDENAANCLDATTTPHEFGEFFEARSCLIEIRKTTAAGAGTLRCKTQYGAY